jgi:4'-phosphopantetheinyl transferase
MSAGRVRVGAALLGWQSATPGTRFAVGRSLMAALVAELTGAQGAEIFRRCPRCGSSTHGAPRVRGLAVAVSLSYAGNMVAAAAVRKTDAAAIGVDIEPEASAARVSELAPLFSPAPPPDLREWTLIEAALKADGRGLNVEPSTLVLGGVAGSAIGDGLTAVLPGRAEPVVVVAVEGPGGFVLSLAVVAAAPEEAARPATPRTDRAAESG